MRRRTRCRDTSSASRATCQPRFHTCSGPPILRPESAEIRHNLGAALWYSGAREKAIAELRESVRLDPGSAGGHAFLGMALLETGDLPGARASLQRAMALSPPMAAAYVDLGVAFLREGNLEKGLGQLEAGLNVPVAGAPTPSWDRPSPHCGRRSPVPARSSIRRRPKRTTCSGSCSGGRAHRRRCGGGFSRSDPHPSGLRRSPQQPRTRAHSVRGRRRGYCRAA